MLEIKLRRNQYESFTVSSCGNSLGVVVGENHCKNQGSPDPCLGRDSDKRACCGKIQRVGAVPDTPNLKGRLNSLRAPLEIAVLYFLQPPILIFCVKQYAYSTAHVCGRSFFGCVLII